MSADGRCADLFNLHHYPVRAVCRVCSQPVTAESFLQPFRHAGVLATVTRLPGPAGRLAPARPGRPALRRAGHSPVRSYPRVFARGRAGGFPQAG